MAQTINTNVASMNAQRNLATSQSSLGTTLQRLSSGLRINRAADDAAANGFVRESPRTRIGRSSYPAGGTAPSRWVTK